MWRERGSAPVLDLESGIEVPVHYRFVEELREFDSRAVRLDIPTLIVHGTDDEVVPSAQSRDFAESHPSVSLVLVQDTHQLLNEAPKILSVIERFILSGSTDSR
jgi:pimeloyl-ACP methyl ester carboxylesterase